MHTTTEKITALANLIHEQTKQYYAERYTYDFSNDVKVNVKEGEKYIKIDVGHSGKYMIEKSTGNIYGIKGYGVIHRGHQYGTLDTVNEYYWGDYVARKLKTA